MADYAYEKARGALSPAGRAVSLEDWVVRNFGRTMFEIYFRPYSEKVWGISCDRICSSWVERRIQGLSLWRAVKNAFFRFSGRDIPTLADSFDYPALGIGRISERLEERITSAGTVRKGEALKRLYHDGGSVTGAELGSEGGTVSARGSHYISTVPLDALVKMMSPAPPHEVMESAGALGFRDLVIVALAVDKENVTGDSWVYIPESKYRFGRLHEPRNWSPHMAPDGKTLVVVEFFCFEGDSTWNLSDRELEAITVDGLTELGFITPEEAMWSEVLRIPRAYPLFEVGFDRHCRVILDYLSKIENLTVAGRAGTFSYLNMDHAIRSGMEAADEAALKVFNKAGSL